MSMSNQTNSVKQNIIDWCNEEKIQCVDSGNANQQFIWYVDIDVNHIIFHQMVNYPDRITIQAQIDIPKEKQGCIENDKNKKSDLLLKLETLATIFRVSVKFIENDEHILIRVRPFKPHYSSTMTKVEFLEYMERMSNIKSTLENHLFIAIGNEFQLQQNQQSQPDANDVGIL